MPGKWGVCCRGRSLKRNLIAALRDVQRLRTEVLLARQYDRYRRIGQCGIRWREKIRTAVGVAIGEALGLLHRRRKKTGSILTDFGSRASLYLSLSLVGIVLIPRSCAPAFSRHRRRPRMQIAIRLLRCEHPLGGSARVHTTGDIMHSNRV